MPFPRQLLIEKFDKPTDISGDKMYWRNENGELHRKNGLPAIMSHDENRYYKHGLHIKDENARTIEEQITEIIKEFDFNKVKKIIDFLEWTWAGDIPTIKEIKKSAIDHLNDAFDICWQYNSEEAHSSSGGLKATYFKNSGFQLQFVLEEWSTFV